MGLTEYAQKLQEQTLDVSNFEQGLRTVIDAFGLVVGLCWEKATDATIETITDGNQVLSDHRVIAKLLLALTVVVLIAPAWLRYIAPMANKHLMHHHQAIELEKMHIDDDVRSEQTCLNHQKHILEICTKLDDDEILSILTRLYSSESMNDWVGF